MDHMDGYVELVKSNFTTGEIQTLKGIEIGCFRGEWSAYMLNHFLDLHLITIDPYIQWPIVLANIDKCIDRFQIIQLKSDEACKILEGEYDFVFIDGDHSYEQCKRDILNYTKFVRPGGLITGHNFHKDPASAHPGVHIAVEEIFQNSYQLHPDFIWWVKKNE